MLFAKATETMHTLIQIQLIFTARIETFTLNDLILKRSFLYQHMLYKGEFNFSSSCSSLGDVQIISFA